MPAFGVGDGDLTPVYAASTLPSKRLPVIFIFFYVTFESEFHVAHASLKLAG